MMKAIKVVGSDNYIHFSNFSGGSFSIFLTKNHNEATKVDDSSLILHHLNSMSKILGIQGSYEWADKDYAVVDISDPSSSWFLSRKCGKTFLLSWVNKISLVERPMSREEAEETIETLVSLFGEDSRDRLEIREI